MKSSPITASRALYIKLGQGGEWETRCLRETQTLNLGYHDFPHEIGLTRDVEKYKQFYITQKLSKPIAASNHASQLLHFYSADESVIWITFSDGMMWWCQSSPEVFYVNDNDPGGSRYRKALGAWRNTSMNGTVLHMHALNGALTRTAGYQQTICSISDDMFQYLLRKINGEEEPRVARAVERRQQLLDSIIDLMKMLTWRDFELLVELVFAQSGWRRMTATGGKLKTSDIEMVLPSTEEVAAVQVKSDTSTHQIKAYHDDFQKWHQMTHVFYVYHTGPEDVAITQPKFKLIGPTRLAPMVLNAGLFDWLKDKVG